MKKIKTIKIGLICALCFSMLSTVAYAEPLDDTNQIESVENIENVEDVENTEDNIDSSAIPNEDVQNENIENLPEDITTQTDNLTQETEGTDFSNNEDNESNKDNNQLTKSWITLSTTNRNVTVKGDEHFTVTLVLQNIDTQEIHKEVLSTEEQLSKTFVIPNGKYKVYIEEETVTGEHCFMEDTLIADGGEIIFDIVFKNLSKDIVYPPTDLEVVPGWKIILKNNMVFITLLVGCGIYLLVRKIQKAREE